MPNKGKNINLTNEEIEDLIQEGEKLRQELHQELKELELSPDTWLLLLRIPDMNSLIPDTKIIELLEEGRKVGQAMYDKCESLFRPNRHRHIILKRRSLSSA